MPPCHRRMVIATNFSSMFDLLHCSIPQTRAGCCLDFIVVSGYRMFLGLSASALPPPTVPVRREYAKTTPNGWELFVLLDNFQHRVTGSKNTEDSGGSGRPNRPMKLRFQGLQWTSI